MYRVTKTFTERYDGKRRYNIGDTYPREGFTPPPGRAEALAAGGVSEMNKTGGVFLEAVIAETDNAALIEQLNGMDVEKLKAYAAENGIDIGNASSAKGIINKIIKAE